MKVGDNVIYKFSSFDKFFGRDGTIAARGTAECKGKRIGVIVQVVEHDNLVRYYVIKPEKILYPKGCKPVKGCMDTARPWEVRYHGKET